MKKSIQEEYQSRVMLWIGSAMVHPKIGGWSYVMHDNANGEIKLDSGTRANAKSYQMALEAISQALARRNPGCEITIVSNNKVIVDAIEFGLKKWIRNNWKLGPKKCSRPVMNADLWQRVCQLAVNCRLRAIWVRSMIDDTNHWCNTEAKRQAQCRATGKTFTPAVAPTINRAVTLAMSEQQSQDLLQRHVRTVVELTDMKFEGDSMTIRFSRALTKTERSRIQVVNEKAINRLATKQERLNRKSGANIAE